MCVCLIFFIFFEFFWLLGLLLLRIGRIVEPLFALPMTTEEDGTRWWWWLGPRACVIYLAWAVGHATQPAVLRYRPDYYKHVVCLNKELGRRFSRLLFCVLCVYWNITSFSFSFDIFSPSLFVFFFFLPKATKPEPFRFCVFNWIATKIVGKIQREIYRKGSWPSALDRRNPHTHKRTRNRNRHTQRGKKKRGRNNWLLARFVWRRLGRLWPSTGKKPNGNFSSAFLLSRRC